MPSYWSVPDTSAGDAGRSDSGSDAPSEDDPRWHTWSQPPAWQKAMGWFPQDVVERGDRVYGLDDYGSEGVGPCYTRASQAWVA